ncbi:MAG: hypothetical protein WED06_01255 [Candidatus Paceibacterota bacterium]
MALQIPPIPGLTEQPNIDFGTDASPFLAQIYEKALDYFQNLDYVALVSNVKVVGIILTIIFAIVFIIILYKMRGLIREEITEFKAELNPPEEAVTAYDNRWQEIKNHVNSFKESEWKLAVIEADKLVDDTLKTAGFQGETMGERLMLVKPGQILNLQYLWDAHKIRNLLVHDVNYQISHKQAVWAVEAFESVMRELGALS